MPSGFVWWVFWGMSKWNTDVGASSFDSEEQLLLQCFVSRWGMLAWLERQTHEQSKWSVKEERGKIRDLKIGQSSTYVTFWPCCVWMLICMNAFSKKTSLFICDADSAFIAILKHSDAVSSFPFVGVVYHCLHTDTCVALSFLLWGLCKNVPSVWKRRENSLLK